MKITEHFDSEEFSCKCGCGFNNIGRNVVEMLEAIREIIGEPIIVTSGCRCSEHNKKVGGSPLSYHLRGGAADITCESGAEKLFKAVKLAWLDNKIPQLRFCYINEKENYLHLDCGRKRKNIFSRI